MTVLIVLAALAVVAYLYRDKIAVLVSKVRTNVSKPDTSKPADVPVVPVVPVAPAGLDFSFIKTWAEADRTYFNVVRRIGRALTDEEKVQALAAGMLPIPATPIPVYVDRSGDDVSDGGPHTYKLANGESKTVTYTLRPETKRAVMVVIAYAGSHLQSVTDGGGTQNFVGSSASSEAELPILPGEQSYTFSAQSIGGSIAVQLQQW